MRSKIYLVNKKYLGNSCQEAMKYIYHDKVTIGAKISALEAITTTAQHVQKNWNYFFNMVTNSGLHTHAQAPLSIGRYIRTRYPLRDLKMHFWETRLFGSYFKEEKGSKFIFKKFSKVLRILIPFQSCKKIKNSVGPIFVVGHICR